MPKGIVGKGASRWGWRVYCTEQEAFACFYVGFVCLCVGLSHSHTACIVSKGRVVNP